MVKYNKKAVIYNLNNMSECVIGYIIMFDNENVDEMIQERLKEIKIFAARLHLFYGCKYLKKDCRRDVNRYGRLIDEAQMIKSGMYTISVIDIKRYYDRKLSFGSEHYRNERIINDVVNRAAQLSKRYENCVAYPKSEKEYKAAIKNIFTENHDCHYGLCKNCICTMNESVTNKRGERSCYGCLECYDREIENNGRYYFSQDDVYVEYCYSQFDRFDHVNTLDF
jgi:hypothetical protein